jgi:hypothetical protein
MFQVLVGCAQLVDPFAGVDHGCVISAAKGVTNLREAMAREFFRNSHS